MLLLVNPKWKTNMYLTHVDGVLIELAYEHVIAYKMYVRNGNR